MTETTADKAAMQTPPVVSPEAWEAARQAMLVKEKALTRARDALAAERRRMPWMAVEKAYAFEGPSGRASLLDLFEGRRQLIVYRAFFEPGVFGWPDHACRGCSLGADQVAHLAHLNARDTTLAYASRAPQADIARLKARMGWEMPWYTITDSFDADFGVDEWHGHNVFIRDGDRVFRTYFINEPRRRGDGQHLELPRHHPARPPGDLGRLARGLSADGAVQVVELARRVSRRRLAAAGLRVEWPPLRPRRPSVVGVHNRNPIERYACPVPRQLLNPPRSGRAGSFPAPRRSGGWRRLRRARPAPRGSRLSTASSSLPVRSKTPMISLIDISGVSQSSVWIVSSLTTPSPSRRCRRPRSARCRRSGRRRRARRRARRAQREAAAELLQAGGRRRWSAASVRIIRPAVRVRSQPTSWALRMVSPRRCSRQVENE